MYGTGYPQMQQQQQQQQHGPPGNYVEPYGDPYGYRGKPGGMYPSNRPVGNVACYIVTVSVMCLIGIGLIMASILSPSYHVVIIAAVVNTISIDIGLFRISTYAVCRNRLISVKLFDQFCETVKSSLDGKTLTQMEVYACGAQQMSANLLSTGCDSVARLRVASYLLLFALLLSAVLSVFGLFLFIMFWAVRRSKQIRMAALVSEFLASMFMIIGMGLYLLVGGTNLNLNITIIFMDPVSFDLYTGFLVCVFATFWSALIPFAFYVVMPSTVCVDYDSDDMDMEKDAFLDSMENDWRHYR